MTVIPGSPSTVEFNRQCKEYTSFLKKRNTHRIETYVEGGVLKLRAVPKDVFGKIKSFVLGDEASHHETAVVFIRNFLIGNTEYSKKPETARAYNQLSETLSNYVEQEFPQDRVFKILFKSEFAKKMHAEHVLMSESHSKVTPTDSKIVCRDGRGRLIEIPASSEYLMLSTLFQSLRESDPTWDKTLPLKDFSIKTVQLALHWMKYNEIPPCSLAELSELKKLSHYLLCEGLISAVDSLMTGVPLDPEDQGQKRARLRECVKQDPKTTDCSIKCREDGKSGLLHCHSDILKRCTRIASLMTAVKSGESKEMEEMEGPKSFNEINLTAYPEEIVSLFLDWLYTDSLLSPCTSVQLVQLHTLAEAVGCSSLSQYCITQIKQNCENHPDQLCALILDDKTPTKMRKLLIQQFSFPIIPRADLIKPFFSSLQKEFSANTDPESITALACLYINCQETMPIEVLIQLKKIVDAGYAPAQYVLGCLHERGIHNVTKDVEQADKLFKLSADQGYAPAQYRYALSLHKDADRWSYELRSTHRDSTELSSREIALAKRAFLFGKEGRRYLKLSSDQGFVPAQCDLAMSYLNDHYSVTHRREHSLKSLNMLVKKEYAKSQGYMALLYGYGLGTCQDRRKAIEFYILAAKQGFPDPLYTLISSYQNGDDLYKEKKEEIIECLEIYGLDSSLLTNPDWRDVIGEIAYSPNFDVLGYWH